MISIGFRIRALSFSLFAVGSIVVIESIAGYITGSLALFGDAAHGAYDTLITMLLLISSRKAAKPPDHDHPYGHMKFEPLGTLIAALFMLPMAAMIVIEAIGRISMGGTIVEASLGFLALGYTIAMDTFRIIVLGLSMRKVGGLALKADLIHASTDFFSTAIAALGLYLATQGLKEADAFAGLILAVALIFLSLRLSRQAIEELTDTAPRGLREELIEVVKSIDQVLECRSLRVRRVGDEFFVEVAILLPNYMGFKEAHNVASKVEEAIKKKLGRAHVTIHFEPE